MTKSAIANILLSITLAFSVTFHLGAQVDIINECQSIVKEDGVGVLFLKMNNRIRIDGVNPKQKIELSSADPNNIIITKIDKHTFNITPLTNKNDTLILHVDGTEGLRKNFIKRPYQEVSYTFGTPVDNGKIVAKVSEFTELKRLEFWQPEGCSIINGSMSIVSFQLSFRNRRDSATMSKEDYEDTYIDYKSESDLFTEAMVEKFKTLLPDDVFYIEKVIVKMSDGAIRRLSGSKVNIVSN